MSSSKTTKKPSTKKAQAAPVVTTPGSAKPTVKEIRYQGLIKGLEGGALGSGSLPLSSGAITAAEIVTQLQAALEAIDATKPAYAAWRTAVAAQVAAEGQVASVVTALSKYLRACYPVGSVTLTGFGLTSRARKMPSAAVKAVAQQKRKSTRAAKVAKPNSNASAAAAIHGALAGTAAGAASGTA